ncbi:hypothetical protein JG688_00002891 [Phytophthora aleatoria]|uniref:RXLR phytopathogen effector protein WY-domain domain-containing protein n=1 Tax=Phytophthora aleatoria TaxID=2496075 RepID=A0A8J5J565_9STRA|nr:hypothetical protein JG688_00002891 [Phytophthora aleatoria]
MQPYMILSSASSHKLVNEAWLDSRETPQQVFKILRLKYQTLDSNPLFIQWLRYVKLYKAQPEGASFSDVQVLNILLKKKITSDTEIGTLFQSIKEIPDLELAKSLQTHLYRKWMVGSSSRPTLESLLGPIHSRIDFSKLPKVIPCTEIWKITPFTSLSTWVRRI